MAKGHECPKCKSYMYAIKEVYDKAQKVTIVTYQCNNRSCNKIVIVKEWA